MLGKNKKLCFYRIAILQILHNQMVISNTQTIFSVFPTVPDAFQHTISENRRI